MRPERTTSEGGESGRHLPLEGNHNTRDLGGYSTVDGRVTNWGKYLRSDILSNLSLASRDTLIDYGVRNVIDLRRSAELQFKPSVFIGCEAVAYYHQNMTGDLALEGAEKLLEIEDQAERRGRRYCLILEQRKQIVKQVMSILALEDGLPAIVHCNAGKDRAGIVAALVLDISGVPRETIVEDYILTARHLIMRYREQNPGVPPEEYTWKDLQDEACHPATMELTLDFLDERYGGIAGYLNEVGVTDEQLEAIRSSMTG
jgi:protein-tyrosine phosphatase